MSSAATGSSSQDGSQRQFTLGLFSSSWLLGLLAGLLLMAAIGGALWQPVHINAFRIPTLLDQLLYPQEDNAWQRLPHINSNLNDVFALDDGDHVWAVGNEGLILFSDDGGRHWQRGKVQLQIPIPATSASSFDFIATTQAGELPASNVDNNKVEQQTKASNSQQLDLNQASSAKSEDGGNQTINAMSANQLPVQSTVDQTGKEGKSFDKDLSAIYFTDSRHGWAAGKDGVILVTQDGGTNWHIPNSGTGQWLASVRFSADGRNGWAVGDSGTIITSGNGGQSWQSQDSGFNKMLLDIYFADALHGWAVGWRGTIIATEDGGNSWQEKLSGVNQNLHSVQFSDDLRHGWAVGNGGVIVTSDDGGQSWQAQTSGTELSLSSVHFQADARHGWAVGGSFFDGESIILASDDGGKSWLIQYKDNNQGLTGIHFASDSHHGWAVGEGGAILASEDGGHSWHPQANSIQQRFTGSWFSGDGRLGWVVGWNGIILTSEDGGKRWQAQASGTQQALSSIYFSADGHHGWAAGGGGTIVASDDGGQSWHSQFSGSEQWLSTIQFAADNRHGWALIGNSPIILRSEDGGQRWQPTQTIGTAPYLGNIYFAADARHGWAVGLTTIIASNDGGNSWQPQANSSKAFLSNIYFAADTRHGWAVGTGGSILASEDAGLTWYAQTSATKVDLSSIYFAADAAHGWVVGNGGVILASNDGGTSWQSQSSGTDQHLKGIQFDADARHGLAVGESSTILTSEDGGKSWLPVAYHRYPAGWVYPVLLIAIGLGFWAYLLSRRRHKTHSAVSGVMNRGLTDQPAGGPEGGADLLGARLLAAGLVRFLSNDKTSPPLTLAITGEWGSGKSSVMNYLFAGLRRNGLKPVMFNAWHHRDEQNVLASIFTNLHKQVIGPWWTLHGLLFRMRLLWKRNLLAKLGLSIVIYSLVFCAMYLPTHTGDRQKLQQYAAYLTGIYQPLLLSQTGYEKLCPIVKPLASEIKSTTETNVEPIAKLETKADSAQAQFGESQCRTLQTELVGLPPQDLYSCLQGVESKHCFKRPQQLIETVEAKLSQQLTVENESKLLAAAEHLHPDFPMSIPPAVLQWLSALVAVLSLLIFKGMTLVGLAPAKLMQGAMTLAGSVPRPGEPVGTRVLFEHHFKRVTEVLGRRRLVLFIDDLDRCDPEHCRQVLEITNFLAGAGNLYVVLGMAPRYVLANVALCFQQVAVAVDEVDRLNGIDNQRIPGIGESWFARHFLQKLIHIEVPVPTPEATQVLALLRGEQLQNERDVEELRLEKLEQAEIMLARIGHWLRWSFSAMLLLAGIAISAGLGGGLWDPWAVQQPKSEQLVNSTVAKAVPAALPATASVTVPEPTAKPENRRAPFSAGQASASHWQRLWPLGLLVAFLSLLLWLARQPNILDVPSLSWLQPLAQRLKIWLFGPETSADSDDFDQALRIWYPLIALANPIPRNVKGFLNQLRYFASREYPQGCKDRGEAQLVAMAVAYYAFAEEMDKVFALAKPYQDQQWLFTDNGFEQHLQANGMAQAVLQAVDAHYTRFGGFPSESERERFKRYHAMISIQRRDPK